MLKFVIDEDMPRSTSWALNGKGHKALDVRDHGLRGKSDQQVYEFAQQEEAIILTGDLGFGNIIRFPIGSHFGIFVVHFPNEVAASELNNQISRAIDILTEVDFAGNLVVLEPGKIRIRRA